MTCPNISAEGAAPTSQPQTERCELEQAFGFQDSAFRDYMLTESAKSGSPHDLVDVAHSMDLAEHPVVMFGAGWALTEAATFRGNREDEYSTLSLGERLDSLQ